MLFLTEPERTVCNVVTRLLLVYLGGVTWVVVGVVVFSIQRIHMRLWPSAPTPEEVLFIFRIFFYCFVSRPQNMLYCNGVVLTERERERDREREREE